MAVYRKRKKCPWCGKPMKPVFKGYPKNMPDVMKPIGDNFSHWEHDGKCKGLEEIKKKTEADRKKRPHGNVKCNCGHTQKDHYQGSGWCHHSKHPKAGQCGCTWFYPNDKYIIKKKKVASLP